MIWRIILIHSRRRLSLLLLENNNNNEIKNLIESIGWYFFFIVILEQATNSKLEQEDWRLYIQICNKIIYISNGPKVARKVLQKKLAVKNDPQTHVLTLSLLRTISENCSEFDDQLQDKSLLEDLTNLWNHSNIHIKVRQKLTECMQLWMIQYQNIPTMQNLIQLCATATCNATPPHVLSIVANQQQQQRGGGGSFLLNRLKNMITQRTLKIKDKKEQDNNIDTRRSNNVDYEEDLLKVQQLIIEEAKTTAEILTHLLLPDKNNDDNEKSSELILEMYRKCKDLHGTIMSYIEDSRASVQISTLIDANSVLVQALETYNSVMQSDLMKKSVTTNNTSVTIPSDKALGKRPIHQSVIDERQG
ncbi:hypothetical protein BDC45DRAFT_558558 [Circinella umbellata]|nr:hypothetical protein BDC45DRAFT_558558 [Circinella umbellata]